MFALKQQVVPSLLLVRHLHVISLSPIIHHFGELVIVLSIIRMSLRDPRTIGKLLA